MLTSPRRRRSSQLAFIPLMERRTPVRRTSEVFQFYRGVSPNVRVKKRGVSPYVRVKKCGVCL